MKYGYPEMQAEARAASLAPALAPDTEWNMPKDDLVSIMTGQSSLDQMLVAADADAALTAIYAEFCRTESMCSSLGNRHLDDGPAETSNRRETLDAEINRLIDLEAMIEETPSLTPLGHLMKLKVLLYQARVAFGGDGPDFAQAEALIERTIRALAPSTSAA